MSRGPTPFWETLEPARLAAIDAAIDGSPRASARKLRVSLGLEDVVTERTFRTYVAKRRQGSAQSTVPVAQNTLAPAEIRSRIVGLIQQRIETGDVPDYLLPKFLDAIVGLDVEARAAEKHDAWRRDVTTKLKAATDVKSEGGKSLTREDVYDLVDQVMRGKA